MAEQVGFIGLGSMGQPMTRNLPRAVYRLVVYEGRGDQHHSALLTLLEEWAGHTIASPRLLAV